MPAVRVWLWTAILCTYVLLASTQEKPTTATTCENENITEGEIMLGDPNDGTDQQIVLVCEEGVLKRICDDDWTILDATVVCRQLGLPDSNVQHYTITTMTFGPDLPSSDEFEAPQCDGSEAELTDCEHVDSPSTGTEMCAVAVKCLEQVKPTITASSTQQPTASTDTSHTHSSSSSPPSPQPSTSTAVQTTPGPEVTPDPETDPPSDNESDEGDGKSDEGVVDNLIVLISLIIAGLIILIVIVTTILVCTRVRRRRLEKKEARVEAPVYSEPGLTDKDSTDAGHMYEDPLELSQKIDSLKRLTHPEAYQKPMAQQQPGEQEYATVGPHYAILEPPNEKREMNSYSQNPYPLPSHDRLMASESTKESGAQYAPLRQSSSSTGSAEPADGQSTSSCGSRRQLTEEATSNQDDEGGYATLDLDNANLYATLQPHIPSRAKKTIAKDSASTREGTYSHLNHTAAPTTRTAAELVTADDHLVGARNPYLGMDEQKCPRLATNV